MCLPKKKALLSRALRDRAARTRTWNPRFWRTDGPGLGEFATGLKRCLEHLGWPEVRSDRYQKRYQIPARPPLPWGFFIGSPALRSLAVRPRVREGRLVTHTRPGAA